MLQKYQSRNRNLQALAIIILVITILKMEKILQFPKNLKYHYHPDMLTGMYFFIDLESGARLI